MKPEKSHQDGEDLHLQMTLPLRTRGGRSMTATITLTALDAQKQAGFDAELERLLATVAGNFVKNGRKGHVQQ